MAPGNACTYDSFMKGGGHDKFTIRRKDGEVNREYRFGKV